MDPTALYYALSTIAQCAAALAALIGFLGLWRLDRLRDEERRAEDEVIGTVLRLVNRHQDEIQRFGRAFFLQKARDLVTEPRPATEPGWEIHHPPTGEQIIKSTLRPILRRYDAHLGAQQRLMCTLSRFLRRTLVILALAIIALAVARALSAWVLTRWMLWVLIILASVSLYRSTASVVHEAVRSTRTLVILATLLILASPALAGPLRCQTYHDPTLNRLQTRCDDGTRVVVDLEPDLAAVDHYHHREPAPGLYGAGEPADPPGEGLLSMTRSSEEESQ